MFVGHVALALGAKRYSPKVSLAWLLAAVLFLDILWPVFVLLGHENFVILVDGTGFKRFAFTWYPWSHSLLMAAVWSVLAGLLATIVGGGKRTALLVGTLVGSHWVLDWVTHTADLPLTPGIDPVRVGLDLWASTPGTFVVEGALFAAGIWSYLRITSAKDAVGTFGLWGLIAIFTALWATVPFVAPPPSEATVAWTGAVGMWVFVAWAWWVDRHRSVAD